jgi:hypothetical protein
MFFVVAYVFCSLLRAVLDRDLVNTQHGRGVGIGRRSYVLCCCTRRWHRPSELCSLLLHMYSVLCWAKFFNQVRKFSLCWTQLRSITPKKPANFQPGIEFISTVNLDRLNLYSMTILKHHRLNIWNYLVLRWKRNCDLVCGCCTGRKGKKICCTKNQTRDIAWCTEQDGRGVGRRSSVLCCCILFCSLGKIIWSGLKIFIVHQQIFSRKTITQGKWASKKMRLYRISI